MVDSDLLDQVQQAQAGPSNADLVGAVHDQQWANSFANTPAPEVLRANVNLADTINRAVTNKMALQAQGDAKALDLMQKTARYKEYLDQAPLREQLLQAHVDATGATERRKAAEAVSQATDTAGLNNDIAKAYADGKKPGTPEFAESVFTSIANHPHADKSHLHDIHKLAGGPEDVDPVAFAMQGKAMEDAAVAAGLKNTRATTVGGKWTLVKGPEAVSNEQKIADEIARIKATNAARNEGKPVMPTPDQKMERADQNLVSGVLNFGHLDDKGNLVPDKGQGTQATHVVSFYQDTVTGKRRESPPIAIDQFRAIQAAVESKKTPAAGPQSYDSPEDFTKAFQTAKPGEIIHYQGKPYKKP